MAQKTTELGRLKQVDLRDYWGNEATDFTPWLAEQENLQLLCDAIGLDLEFLSREEYVGSYRADILCVDVNTNQQVIIENQLEETDTKHLGQIMTYIAGLNAVTAIWVAKSFRDEHRAVIDWLNNMTDDSFNCFGVEIKLVQIGDSQLAPLFKVVASPNGWTKLVRETGNRETSQEGLQRYEFWKGFYSFLDEHKSVQYKAIKPTTKTYFQLTTAVPKMYITFNVRRGKAWSHLTFRNDAMPISAWLKENHRQMLTDRGLTVSWNGSTNEEYIYFGNETKFDVSNTDNWLEQYRQFKKQADEISTVFFPLVKEYLANSN